MVLGWLRRRRRRRFLSGPLPNAWRGYLDANFAHYAWLSAPERARLDGLTQILVAEKNWEGCNGLVMTDEVKVTIAAQAGLLAIGLVEEYFEAILSVLVYPSGYVVRETVQQPGGVVIEGHSRGWARHRPLVRSSSLGRTCSKEAAFQTTASTSSSTSSPTPSTCRDMGLTVPRFWRAGPNIRRGPK